MGFYAIKLEEDRFFRDAWCKISDARYFLTAVPEPQSFTVFVIGIGIAVALGKRDVKLSL